MANTRHSHIRSRTRQAVRALLLIALVAVPLTPSASAQRSDNAVTDAAASAADPAKLTLVGGDKVVWGYRVWQIEKDSKKSDFTQFAYRAASKRFGRRFWRAALVEGTARIAVVRDDILHAFYPDGSHWRYGLMDTVATGSFAPPVSRGIQLPERGVPLALCTDRENGAIIAIVTQSVANGVLQEQRERLLQKLRTDAQETGENPDNVTLPPADKVKTDLAVVKYEDAEWAYLRPGPTTLTEKDFGSAALLLSAGGVIHLLAPAASETETTDSSRAVSTWQYLFASDQSDGWIGQAPLNTQAPAISASAGWKDANPFIVTVERTEATHAGRTYARADQTWTPGPELTDKDGAPLSLDKDSRAALMGDKIVALLRGKSGALRSATFSAASGKAIDTALVAEALDRSPAQRRNPMAESVIQYAFLIGVMAALFFYRRDRVVAIMPIPANTSCARLLPRFAALMIDVLITAPFWIIALYALVYAVAPASTVSVHLTLPPEELETVRFWGGAVVGGVIAIYGCICELTTGRTIGKWILRLSITEDGRETASAKAIILRNAARIIEFHFLVLALLVVLTPSKQRLGDLLGRTVIVEPEFDQPTPQDRDDFDQTA